MITKICDECGKHVKIKRCKYGTGLCKSCIGRINGAKYKDPSKTTCPKCGNKKSHRAKTCKACSYKRGPEHHSYGKPNPKLLEYNKNNIGSNHPRWKGGVSKISGKQTYWSKMVKERDKYKCQICNFKNPIIMEAHHIEHSEARYWDDRSYKIELGICLCPNCHKLFHKVYGYGNNTKEQFDEFLNIHTDIKELMKKRNENLIKNIKE